MNSPPTPAESGPPWIYVAPYLALREPITVAPDLRLVPLSSLDPDDPLSPVAGDVLAMYERPADGVGAFLCTPTLGSGLEDQTFGHAAQLLTFLVLEANPKPSDGQYSALAGHSAQTTENAMLRGHRVDGSSTFVWVHRGVVQDVSVTMQLGRARDSVPLPPTVRSAAFGSRIDASLAPATWKLLTSGRQAGRRIGRAIDWLGIAWSNADIGVDVRIQALHAGFDALLGTDDERSNAKEMRERLCALVDPQDEPRIRRPLVFRGGNQKDAEVSERGYWFHHFTELRNGIAHGDDIADLAYHFDGYPHFNRAEHELRAAILGRIARESGDELLAIPDRLTRYLTARIREAEEQLLAPEDGVPTRDRQPAEEEAP